MTGRLDAKLHGWADKTVTLERVEALMDRGSALALAVEKWLRSGLWIMTRSDRDYPQKLKEQLGNDSPAVLFGCGNRALLNGGGLAVVGSRNTSDHDLAYSRKLGKLAAKNAKSIVSGGARGVDENAMLGALEAEGTVIGVLADSLSRASSSAKYRHYLMAKDLALVSPFYPEAGFNVGNAMQRNKYIYCLSDAALVVHSGTKGGTWSGAKENQRKQWVPLWVKDTDDKAAGNAAIVRLGATGVSNDVDTINFPALFEAGSAKTEADGDLFGKPLVAVEQKPIESLLEPESESELEPEPEPEQEPKPEPEAGRESETVLDTESDSAPDSETDQIEQLGGVVADTPVANFSMEQIGFYDFFLMKVELVCGDSPKTGAELAELLTLNKTQLNAWLKRAVEERKIRKLSKPVCYQWNKQFELL